MLIKYIKSLLWRVAKRLSYIEDARCLKVKTATDVTARLVVRAIEEVGTQIEAATVSSGLVINERKSKNVSKNVTDLEKHLIRDGQVCEGVQNDVNNQQEAITLSFINLFKLALHVSGNKFAHPQEQFF